MTDAIAVLKSAAIQTEYNGNAWTTLVHAAQHLDANAKPERKTECVTTATPSPIANPFKCLFCGETYEYGASNHTHN